MNRSKSTLSSSGLLSFSSRHRTATKQELIEKAKKEWGETWNEGMIEYDAEYNEYIVWVGKPDIYKAFFDADTLRCIGTKC